MANPGKICIVGDGGWGTTIGILLSKKGLEVAQWGVFGEYIEIMKKGRENVKFLPGIKIPEAIKLTASLEDALDKAKFVVLAVPSQFMRSVLEIVAMQNITGKEFISLAKGIENVTLKRVSEVVREVLGKCPLAVLSGPTIALEIANGAPASACIASDDQALALKAQAIFMTDRFRIYTTPDIAGLEVGGSLKNIIAIAAGTSDGLGFGANAKAALLTRGLVEMVRLGVAMGAKRETFYGLSGLGDLATTCMSQYSRNRWLGEEIGRGKKLRDVLGETDMVVEGVATAKSAFELSRKFKIDMPITTEIYKVLYENKEPRRAVQDLMTRSPKEEGF